MNIVSIFAIAAFTTLTACNTPTVSTEQAVQLETSNLDVTADGVVVTGPEANQ